MPRAVHFRNLDARVKASSAKIEKSDENNRVTDNERRGKHGGVAC